MYQPSPALTPSISATIRVTKVEPRPMNRPTNTCGRAAGTATLRTRNHCPAPRVRATSKYPAFTEATPDQVSTVTGNHAESATRKVLAEKLVGNTTNTIGSQAVAGTGPISLRTGCTQ